MRPQSALLFAFALSAVWFTGFVPPDNNPNELTRLEAAVAWVDHGTFSIDPVLPRLGNTMDKSVWNGRYYSNKAPGLIFAAIPVYRALRCFFPEPRTRGAWIFVLVRLATVTLVSLIGLARLGPRLEHGRASPHERGRPPSLPGGAALGAYAVAFGTPFLYYARSFFSHAWTAALLFLAWDLLRAGEDRRGRRPGLLLASGFVAGWAAISEYTAAPIGLALALRAAVTAPGSRLKSLALFTAGALPPLLLLAAYDAACFGSPWRLSSACEAFPAYAQLARMPLFGLGLPRGDAVVGTLVSSKRGLLLYSPFLLWAPGGWWHWWRSGQDRRDCLFSLTAVLLLWIPIVGYPNWDGGWSLGMRYLVPAVFFAALPLPRALASPLSRGFFLTAVTFSAALHVLASVSWPHFPGTISWPVANVSAWLVRRGALAPNIGSLLGWPAWLCLLPPVAAASAALAVAARMLSAARPRRWVACALGVICFGATLVHPPAISSAEAAWRERTAGRLRDWPVPPR
jgi:hypothetical protein